MQMSLTERVKTVWVWIWEEKIAPAPLSFFTLIHPSTSKRNHSGDNAYEALPLRNGSAEKEWLQKRRTFYMMETMAKQKIQRYKLHTAKPQSDSEIETVFSFWNLVLLVLQWLLCVLKSFFPNQKKAHKRQALGFLFFSWNIIFERNSKSTKRVRSQAVLLLFSFFLFLFIMTELATLD